MERITNLIGKLEAFLDHIDAAMEEATIEAEETIVDMNIMQLYDYGEDRNGQRLSPDYAPATVAIKREKGQRTDHVTLRDTMDWQLSFYVKYLPDGFEIDASDWKTSRLKMKYGEAILGLQDEMIPELLENFYHPRLMADFKMILGYE